MQGVQVPLSAGELSLQTSQCSQNIKIKLKEAGLKNPADDVSHKTKRT